MGGSRRSRIFHTPAAHDCNKTQNSHCCSLQKELVPSAFGNHRGSDSRESPTPGPPQAPARSKFGLYRNSSALRMTRAKCKQSWSWCSFAISTHRGLRGGRGRVQSIDVPAVADVNVLCAAIARFNALTMAFVPVFGMAVLVHSDNPVTGYPKGFVGRWNAASALFHHHTGTRKMRTHHARGRNRDSARTDPEGQTCLPDLLRHTHTDSSLWDYSHRFRRDLRLDTHQDWQISPANWHSIGSGHNRALNSFHS